MSTVNKRRLLYSFTGEIHSSAMLSAPKIDLACKEPRVKFESCLLEDAHCGHVVQTCVPNKTAGRQFQRGRDKKGVVHISAEETAMF